MGQAVHTAIDMLEARKQAYRANGIAYYRQWIFMITDGAPTDSGWEAAAERSVGGKSEVICFFRCWG